MARKISPKMRKLPKDKAKQVASAPKKRGRPPRDKGLGKKGNLAPAPLFENGNQFSAQVPKPSTRVIEEMMQDFLHRDVLVKLEGFDPVAFDRFAFLQARLYEEAAAVDLVTGEMKKGQRPNIAAATILLAYGYGKPKETVELTTPEKKRQQAADMLEAMGPDGVAALQDLLGRFRTHG